MPLLPLTFSISVPTLCPLYTTANSNLVITTLLLNWNWSGPYWFCLLFIILELKLYPTQETDIKVKFMGHAGANFCYMVTRDSRINLYELDQETSPRLRLLKSHNVNFYITAVTPHPIYEMVLAVTGRDHLLFLQLNSIGDVMNKVVVPASLLTASSVVCWLSWSLGRVFC